MLVGLTVCARTAAEAWCLPDTRISKGAVTPGMDRFLFYDARISKGAETPGVDRFLFYDTSRMPALARGL